MSRSSPTAHAVTPGSAGAHVGTKDRYELSPSIGPFRVLRKMPSIQRVDTSQNAFYTSTATSAQSTMYGTSSISGSPNSSTYSTSPFVHPQHPLIPIDPLDLPEPAWAYPHTSSYSRQNGLTRKLSSGKRALSRLGRTTSSGAASRRDPSSGPVVRRRSDSKTATMSAFESDDPVPEIPSTLSPHGYMGTHDDTGSSNELYNRKEQRAEVVAPAIPREFIAGCPLVRITKRKCQERLFTLDSYGSAVSWNGRTLISKRFYVDDIKSIRSGLDSADFLATITTVNVSDFDPSRFFTINYAPSKTSNGTKTLYLLAPTSEICSRWVTTLEALSKHREELMLEMSGTERQSVLREHWDHELDKQSRLNGGVIATGLDRHTVAAFCRKLHIHCPKTTIDDGFVAVDAQRRGLLDFDQFRAFVRRLKSRVDLKPLFNSQKSIGVDGISMGDFLQFLRVEQGINVDANLDYWVEKFNTFAALSDVRVTDRQGNQHMDFSAFTTFMKSPDCHVHASPGKPKSKLDRPLNEYFISSSHNTYLSGRQVNGTSSIEPYLFALRRGCRSVEIDCWDGDHGNPRVTHGYTKTTSISFSEVCRAINRCAFDTSQYPVILSLEVHCNPSQQLRMVEIMKECFDPKVLLLYSLPTHNGIMPSPEELKNKILVKVKATDAHPTLLSIGEALSVERQRSSSSPTRKATIAMPNLAAPGHGIGSPLLISPPESTDPSIAPTSEEELESDVNSIAPVSSDATPKHKTSKITQELASLGVYMQGYSYRSAADLAFHQFNHIFSINEHTAMNVSKGQDTKIAFEKHNTSYMCRVYPKNTRINSSNFDPNTFWRRGVQMVALNWQTYDIHMQMNQAMFAAGSDRTGYVLKPSYLRDASRYDGRMEHKARLPHYQINFTIKVISAQQLPLLSTMDKNQLISPYVQVQMFSAEDVARKIASGQGGEEVSRSNGYYGIGKPFSRQTKTVLENGFNPQFNDKIELSIETKYPELVFVRFAVYQSGKGSKELAVFTSKLDSLQSGYRHLPLYNHHGDELIFSTLFCHIAKQTPTTVCRDTMPSRTGSIRKLLSRSNTVDRGRPLIEKHTDNERMAVQKKSNLELDSRKL